MNKSLYSKLEVVRVLDEYLAHNDNEIIEQEVAKLTHVLEFEYEKACRTVEMLGPYVTKHI